MSNGFATFCDLAAALKAESGTVLAQNNVKLASLKTLKGKSKDLPRSGCLLRW
jgi:hypothetical protein